MDPRFISELRELARRYDWPWRASLLYDDFRDGDYTFDPRWIVTGGDFWVSQGTGLRTRFDPPSPSRRSSESSAVDLLEGIFRGVTARRGPEAEPQAASAADIHSDVRITNAFAIKFELATRGHSQPGNRLEFGPYRGAQQDWGYRLAYDPGKRPSFTLLRLTPGRSAIIEIYDQAMDVDDGRPQQVEWRRGTDGEMVVFLDGKEIIRTVDRAYNDSFEGFTISNKGGDYTISQVAIFGTSR